MEDEEKSFVASSVQARLVLGQVCLTRLHEAQHSSAQADVSTTSAVGQQGFDRIGGLQLVFCDI